MEPFKDELSAAKARHIGRALQRVFPAFPLARFGKNLEPSLAPLELKQRVAHLAGRIADCLPADPRLSFPLLSASVRRDEGDAEGLSGFLVWPLTEVVATRGLGHFAESMAALRELTRAFTAEFAIRPFLHAEPERTLRQLQRWCDDPCPHVRRLVSEGSRPLLPWGMRLPGLLEAPFPTLDLLEKLRLDPADPVRLSVSNHLNDFSKHHPELVLRVLRRWGKQDPGDERIVKITRHACRTLVKAGDPGALRLLGFGDGAALTVESLSLAAPLIRIGEALEYRLVIHNPGRSSCKALFDYAIHHHKADGSLRPKVFKGRVRELAAGERWEILGRHSFRPVTTRVYHPGPHAFEVRLNGRGFAPLPFQLAETPAG
jgi:3-methyladenine DNA glycosylase AlkC